MDGLVLPVVVGLGIGVAFVTLFVMLLIPSQSSTFNPVTMAKVDGYIIADANNLKEVQVFYSEYPGGDVRVDRTGNEIEGSAVKYSFQKVYEDGKINELRMFVMLDDRAVKPDGPIFVDCAESYVDGFGGRTYSAVGYDITTNLHSTTCAK